MTQSLTERQAAQLCEFIGKMLALELESGTVKTKIKKMVADNVKKSELNIDPTAVSERLHWHLQVMLKK